MRPLPALLALLVGLGLAGCGTHSCQQLGDRICQCVGAGSARDTCKTEVQNQLSAFHPGGVDYAACEAALVTCSAPAGANFCEWINTTGGKVACGLAYPPPAP